MTRNDDRWDAKVAIVNAIADKQRKVRSIPIPTAPSILDIPNGLITFGSFSWYVRPRIGKPYRLIFKDKCREVAPNLWATPTQIAREYINYKADKLPLRARMHQITACTEPKRYPPLYSGIAEGDLVYVDMKAAYWTILQVIGWDVQYMPNKYIGRRMGVSDFPYPDWKMARNCLVTVGRPATIRTFDIDRKKFDVTTVGSRYTNNLLWAAVMDILNGIARDAVRLGAYYVYTDGYIFRERDFERAKVGLDAWGLTFEVRHRGHGFVSAPGCYSVGDHTTRVVDRVKMINKISNQWDVDLLKSTVSGLASSVELVYE